MDALMIPTASKGREKMGHPATGYRRLGRKSSGYTQGLENHNSGELMALNFAFPRLIRNSNGLHDSGFPQGGRVEANRLAAVASKVPQIAMAFWVIKIAATTLGETGGDALSMTSNLGYALSTVIFMACFLVAVTAQIKAKSFHRFLYWTVIVATTTVGTTLADFTDRSLGVGYMGGSLILFAVLMLTLAIWRLSAGSISFRDIISPKVEMFYWITILFSNTLGTALGDWLADTQGVGYERGALVFAGALTLVAAAYFFTDISRTMLFWTAFILTRPLGATLGDMLTKPVTNGGLNLSRITSSLVIAVFMVLCILFTSPKAGQHPGEELKGRG
jgi:uncharacterized membrane-anchored protein